MQWMFLPFRRYFDFSGRSRRMEYWMFQLLNVIVIVVLICLILAGMPWDTMDDPAPSEEAPGALSSAGIILATLWILATIIPALAVTVRRFHDQDKSGWMFLLNFIPVVGGWIVLFFMVMPGTFGENSYGPDPKDPHSADVFE